MQESKWYDGSQNSRYESPSCKTEQLSENKTPEHNLLKKTGDHTHTKYTLPIFSYPVSIYILNGG